MSLRYTQSCPTCGRRVQIRASLIGYSVACQHCRAEFIADVDGESRTAGVDGSPRRAMDPLMARVEEALQRAAQQPTTVT